MEAHASSRRCPQLPIEIWKEIAAHILTDQWAQVCGTCRATSQVQPRRLSTGQHDSEKVEDLRWAMKHCSEARTLDIFLRNTACKGLADVMTAGSHHKRVQRIAIFFDFEHKNGRPGFDEKDLPWLATFLRRATQLEDLVLDAVTIDVTMLMMLKAQLKHLRLSFRLPFPADTCHSLQHLHKLITLNLEVQFNSLSEDHVVPICGLDLRGCCNLRKVQISMLEPAMLSVPPGCYVSVERDILWMDERKWQVGAAIHNACTLRSNAYGPTSEQVSDDSPCLAGHLGWLSGVKYPNLTMLEVDYPKISSAFYPLVIGDCLMSLQHLNIASQFGYVIFEADIRLKTLIIDAERSIYIYLINLSAFAAGLQRLDLTYRSCCSTTYRLATALTSPDDWFESNDLLPEDRWTEVRFP